MIGAEGQVETGLMSRLGQWNNLGDEGGAEGINDEDVSNDTEVTLGQEKDKEVKEVGRVEEIPKCGKNIRIRRRNSGKSYVCRFGKEMRRRKMKNGCGDGCKYKCHEHFSGEMRGKYLICFGGLKIFPDRISF